MLGACLSMCKEGEGDISVKVRLCSACVKRGAFLIFSCDFPGRYQPTIKGSASILSTKGKENMKTRWWSMLLWMWLSWYKLLFIQKISRIMFDGCKSAVPWRQTFAKGQQRAVPALLNGEWGGFGPELSWLLSPSALERGHWSISPFGMSTRCDAQKWFSLSPCFLALGFALLDSSILDLLLNLKFFNIWSYGSNIGAFNQVGGFVGLALKCGRDFSPLLVLLGTADAVVLWKMEGNGRENKPGRKAFYSGRPLQKIMYWRGYISCFSPGICMALHTPVEVLRLMMGIKSEMQFWPSSKGNFDLRLTLSD